MDIQAYIQSGILEAYALGALPASEAAEVEALVTAHPALRAELDAIQESLRAYAEASPKVAPANLEARIWKAIEATGKDSASPAPAEHGHEHRDGPRLMPLPVSKRRRASFGFARAAALVALVGSLALNAYLWSDRRRFHARIARMEARNIRQNTLFASRMEERDRRISSYAMMQELITDPAVTTVKLQNLRQDAERTTVIFQNRQTGAAYFAVKTLPPLPPDKQYQLWVLEEGTPRGIALLQNSVSTQATDELQVVPVLVNGGEAFAISIENAGGSLTPTTEQIVMLGKVQA